MNESSDGMALEECNYIDLRAIRKHLLLPAWPHFIYVRLPTKVRSSVREALGPAANINYETNDLY